MSQVLAVFVVGQKVSELLQRPSGTSLHGHFNSALGGTLGVFALLHNNGEALFVGSWYNAEGLLVHDSTVAVGTDIGQVVGLLQ